MANRFFPNCKGYKITSRFGVRTLNGTTRMHNGIDLVGTNGSNSLTDYITAHTGGTVTAVAYDSTSGNYVKIEVAPNTYMVYCHLKEMSTLKKGQSVKQGDIIGYMGSTGRSTGAHLHWGIKENGKWIDPEPYLDKDYIKPVKTVTIEMETLRKGSKGEQVKTLQRLLMALGYDLGKYGADGDFGAKTDEAVRAFQKAKGLGVDGIVGTNTWNKLLKG